VRLRDWAGTIVTVISAALEHWLGETMTVAALTAAVVVFGGILWRRVSVLMAAPQANNCTKAYAVEDRLVNYMGLMKGLAPIANANSVSTTNATFLAGLSKLPHQSGLADDPYNGAGPNWQTGERGYVNSSIDYINVIDGNLQSHGYMS
jgi:hypothetical protein